MTFLNIVYCPDADVIMKSMAAQNINWSNYVTSHYIMFQLLHEQGNCAVTVNEIFIFAVRFDKVS